MTTILTMTTDIIIDIIQFLNYTNALMFIDVLQYYNIDLLYYTNDKIYNIIYNTMLKKYLDNYNISNLYECIINSSFSFIEVTDNLNCIFNITKDTRKCFTINYNIKDDTVPLDKILNTINILNIYIDIVRENTQYIDIQQENAIERITNNPYNYLLIHITDKLFSYLLNISIYNYKIKPNKIVKKNIHNITFELYKQKWNKTDISIYYLFQLYLVSIDVINIKMLDNIKLIVVNNKYKKNTKELLDALKQIYTYDVNDILDNNLKYINTQDTTNANINT